MLNLYLLFNTKCQGWGEDVPELVVAAEDEKSARELAEREKYTGLTGWIDTKRTLCKCIGVALQEIEPGVIDFPNFPEDV